MVVTHGNGPQVGLLALQVGGAGIGLHGQCKQRNLGAALATLPVRFCCRCHSLVPCHVERVCRCAAPAAGP